LQKAAKSFDFTAFYGGPEGIRTHDLTDANELKALICIDFQTFPALSAGM
jgi:hypothetical protein